MTGKILTANRLSDGATVYLDGSHVWLNQPDRCRPVTEQHAIDALLAAGDRAVRSGQVIEPGLIDVIEDNSRIVPVRLKEKIRATGPTVRPDLHKNTAPERTARHVSL